MIDRGLLKQALVNAVVSQPERTAEEIVGALAELARQNGFLNGSEEGEVERAERLYVGFLRYLLPHLTKEAMGHEAVSGGIVGRHDDNGADRGASGLHSGAAGVTLVVAGSHRQFQSYLAENGLTRRDAVYLYSREQLRGVDLGSAEIVYYGTWEDNPLVDMLEHRLLNQRVTALENELERRTDEL